MKPASVVADEMFPEGAGPYMDVEEVLFFVNFVIILLTLIIAQSHCTVGVQ